MEIREAIESLKNNNELCLDNCEGECGSYKDGKCYCADALVVSALEEYITIGTVEECREAREYLKFYQMAVNDEPTAYDVDKVVEQLKKEFVKYYGSRWDEIPYLVKAIKIVKSGRTNGY